MSESSVTEVWRDVVGYEGLYQVSNMGQVRSVDRIVTTKRGVKKRTKGRVLSQGCDQWGRRNVVLGRGNNARVHALVAESFIGPRPDGMVVAHWDNNASNNHVDNLRYTTQRGNVLDKARHGTQTMGESHGTTKITQQQAEQILRMSEQGMTIREIVDAIIELPLSYGGVAHIVKRSTWGHLR